MDTEKTIAEIRKRLTQLKRKDGTFNRDEFNAAIAEQFNLKPVQARCLIGAAMMVPYEKGANFSIKLMSNDWLALYELVTLGYATTINAAIRRALDEALKAELAAEAALVQEVAA